MENEELLTSKEVAAHLRTTERFVRRLVAEKKIEYIKAGRAVRFTRRSVAEYIDRNRIRPMTRAQLRASILAGE